MIAGLALPTAAAVILMFTATGAAVATSTTKTVNVSQSATAVFAAAPAPVDPAAEQAARLKAVARTAAVTRAQVAARIVRNATAAQVSRSLQRKAVALKAKKARVARTVVANAVAAQARARTQRSAEAAHGWQLPITNPVKTSGFGYRWGRLHAGEDFGVPIGTPLASMSAGTVAFAGEMSGFGNLVQVRYWDGTISYFGHMSSISVHVGENVDRGQIVGQSGNTGHSTGPHLHYETRVEGEAVDPQKFLRAGLRLGSTL